MVRRQTRDPSRHRGVILLTALLVVTGLTALTTVGLTRAMTEQRMAGIDVSRAQLFALAEAGIDDSIVQLKADLADNTWSVYGPIINTLVGMGNYTVTITSLGNYQGQTLVDDVLFQLDSTGCFQLDPTGTVCVGPSHAVTTVYRIGTLWKYAILGDGSLGPLQLQSRHTLQRTTVDAYDSTLGNYGVGNEGKPALLGDLTSSDTQRSGEGNAGSSSGGSGEPPVLFQVSQQSGLHSDIESNVSLEETIRVSPNSTWEGKLSPMPGSQTIYPINVPPSCPPDPNNWIPSYTVNPTDNPPTFTGSLTICVQNLTIDGNTLQVGNESRIFISGTLTLKNGASIRAVDASTNVSRPIWMQIYIMNTDPTNTQPGLVMDDSVLHAGVYAPGRAATITGGAFYGAIVASQVTANNTSIHQDRGIYGAKRFTEEEWHEN